MSDVSISYFLKSNNLYATSYLKEAEYELRQNCRDLAQEVLDQQNKEKALQESLYIRDGYHLRNSEQEWNNKRSRSGKNGTTLLF